MGETTHCDVAKYGSPRASAQETRAQKLLREIERVSNEAEAWRKKAETAGPLFDLKKDSLMALQKAIMAKIARLKAQQKPVG
jgi:hypothetical protein